MSRRAILGVTATVVCLYTCIILLVLAPLDRGFGQNRGPRSVPAWCRGLRWNSAAPNTLPVALASFPGSGNTWLRYLLQQATGVVTGSIYLDYSLRSHGFPAENVSDATTLVVKTHETPLVPPHTQESRYRAAVLLVRSPQHAILADFNRQHKGHIGTAPLAAFTARDAQGRQRWTRHVALSVRGWQHFHMAWLRFPAPLHIVQYEQLVTDTRNTLLAILHFLNHTVTQEGLECTMSNKEGIYRRRHSPLSLRTDPFPRRLAPALRAARRAVYALIAHYQRTQPGFTLVS